MCENKLKVSDVHKLSVWDIERLLQKFGKIVALYGKRKKPAFEIHAVGTPVKEQDNNQPAP